MTYVIKCINVLTIFKFMGKVRFTKKNQVIDLYAIPRVFNSYVFIFSSHVFMYISVNVHILDVFVFVCFSEQD